MSRLDVLLLEPYFTGSHRSWAVGYQGASRHRVTVLELPGRFWKWRMHGAAITLARRVREAGLRPDVILASDMLDLAAFLGLTRDELAGVPVALYMHENQLAYPSLPDEPGWSESRRRRAARRDEHYGFVNLTSALAADVVLWNSDYNRRSFLERLPKYLGSFPDHREKESAARVAERSRVLPLGIDLEQLDDQRPGSRRPGPPRVVWNHRWEHDKNPDGFFGALDELARQSIEFEVIVLGESFVKSPPAFDEARGRLGDRILHFGFADDRADYARWLWMGDVVASTARHEFFGAAICEAIYCECRPLLPSGLAYPELVPDELHDLVLYNGQAEFVDRLGAALSTPKPALSATLRESASRFDWSAMHAKYDAVLAELAATGSNATHCKE